MYSHHQIEPRMSLRKRKHKYWDDLVDTDRYPIRDLSTRQAKKLIAACRKQLKLDGSLLLEGFIRKEHIEEMKREVSGQIYLKDSRY